MSGIYVIPLYHLPAQWVARWAAIRHPDATSLSGYLPETWWREPEKSCATMMPIHEPAPTTTSTAIPADPAGTRGRTLDRLLR